MQQSTQSNHESIPQKLCCSHRLLKSFLDDTQHEDMHQLDLATLSVAGAGQEEVGCQCGALLEAAC